MVRLEFIPLPEFPHGFVMETYHQYLLEDDGNYYHHLEALDPTIVEQIPDVGSSVAHQGYIYTRQSKNHITGRMDYRREIQEIYQKAWDRIQSVQFEDQPVRFMHQLQHLSEQPIEMDGYTFVIRFNISEDHVELRVANRLSETCIVGFITVAKVYDESQL
jgi:hypothetical protein